MPRFEQNVAAIPDRQGLNPFTRQPIVIRGRPGRSRFWEIEQHGSHLLVCAGDSAGRVTRKKLEQADEDAARIAMGQLVARKRRAGFAPAGPSRELEAPAPARPPGSSVLIDEYFAAGDARFLDEVLHFAGAQKLAALAEPWYRDTRPFARRMFLGYVDDGCDRPQHKGLVKRLFKLAEKAGDDEAMGHFMVAFDRLLRRALMQTGTRWNQALRQAEPVMGLRVDPALRERLDEKQEDPLFTRSTRRYLVRRVFRYFRRLGHRDVARYGTAIRAVLPLYRDEHLSTPARLLDAWGLMHVLYGYSKVLEKAPRGLRLADGRALSELEPAPYFPAAWEGRFDELLVQLLVAKSRTVRAYTLGWLRSKYANQLASLSFADVKRLLSSEHEEVQLLGAELLKGRAGLEAVPLADWLEMLRLTNLDVLQLIVGAVEKYVSPARLSLAQAVNLACAPAAPVALLGFRWAKGKKILSELDVRLVVPLCNAGVAEVRREGTQWCTELLRTLPFAQPEHLRDLCDARHEDARAQALPCLLARWKDHLPTWFALTESPYADVRDFVIEHASAWHTQAEPSTLAHVWTSAVLAVHRGGFIKQRVARDIADRIASHPGEASTLLPILGFALRSVRPAERAVALSALARAVVRQDSLRALARKHLPDVVIGDLVTG